MDLIPRRFYLDDFFDSISATKNEMKCDIYEKKGNYHIDIDLPGYEKEEIKLDINDGILTVSASKNHEEEDSDKNYFRRERVYSSVSRSFSLADVNEELIDAEFKNGILKIVLPKKEQTETKKSIEIK